MEPALTAAGPLANLLHHQQDAPILPARIFAARQQRCVALGGLLADPGDLFTNCERVIIAP